MVTAVDVKKALSAAVTPGKKELLQRFFKTGKGQYGEGDVFLGVMVPEQRVVAKKYAGLPLSEVKKLLESKVHEHRLTTLLILVYKYGGADGNEKKEIYGFYLANARRINNWDLVDVTAPRIVGDWLLAHPRERVVLYRLAKSENLWEHRIAVISTLAFIVKGEFDDTFRLCELFLDHEHDLMHKACGWMLREVGKRDQKALCAFLDAHARKMPRTMLRYAIERFDGKKRRHYLNWRPLS